MRSETTRPKEMITEHNGQLWRKGNEVYFSGQWIKVTNPPKEVQG